MCSNVAITSPCLGVKLRATILCVLVLMGAFLPCNLLCSFSIRTCHEYAPNLGCGLCIQLLVPKTAQSYCGYIGLLCTCCLSLHDLR